MGIHRVNRMEIRKRLTGEQMKRAFVLALFVLTSACGAASPDPGQEAVLVRKPWVFGHGGIDKTPVKTGQTWTAPSTQIWYVVVQPQQFHEHFDDLFSRDGTPLDFDASVRLQITDSVAIVEKFGAWTIDGKNLPAWYVNNLQQPFITAVRQAVRNHGMNELVISATAIDQVDREVGDAVRTVIDQKKLPITLIDLTIGKANPPDAIKSQRAETAAQEQRVNTEKQKKLAEDQRKEAETSRAAADNAYREAMKLTPDQFLQLEQIKMLNQVCAGGKCTFLMGGGVVPTANVR
jgi:regulator of protease activity HflC (stomatin/prohibitin superfamily)